jgi:hypothetical protein
MLSTILHAFTAAIAAHPAIATWAAATLLALYRTRTPAQWVALGESNARLQGLFKLARGGGVDPARLLEGAEQIVTGRRVVDPRDARIAELEAALAGYQRRAMASHAVTLEAGAGFDPSARLPLDRDSQRGSVGVRALGFVLLLAVASGVALAHCTATRRFVLDHTDGVPARVQCTPRTQVCVLTDAGVYLPSVYSDECRAWPTLPRRPDGVQRTCAAGEGCVVEGDGGVAHCTAADGGGR